MLFSTLIEETNKSTMSRHYLFLLILSIFLSSISCSNDDAINQEKPPVIQDDALVIIPVVIHVVNYAPDPFEMSDETILSQIKVLNQDFGMKNPDIQKVPDEFKPFITDTRIQFELAKIDPQGNPTTGIIRTMSEVTGWNGRPGTGETEKPIEERTLYFTEKGGQNAWPNDRYLNIWIALLDDRNGNFGLAGYANIPGSDPRIDGIVVEPRAFGLHAPYLVPKHHLGRTTTHEVGHWLNLKHIFGQVDNCDIGDEVDDTPTQFTPSNGNPSHPKSSCGSNDMFMNFMDYSNDESLLMFTKGQKERMRALFKEGGARRALYLNCVQSENN